MSPWLAGERRGWDLVPNTCTALYCTALYCTVCRRALNYLLTDPLAKAFRVDGIHLVIALYFTKVGLGAGFRV
jgi:hypothetical protein